MRISRRDVLIVGAGCAVGLAPAPAQALEGDLTIGDPAARVHLMEYASLTCSHCAAFHAHTFPQLKARYIDTDRIAFTLREFPTPPVPVSVAMFQVARCGDISAREYYRRIAVLFQQQRPILETGTGAGVVAALVRLGAEWGLTEAEVTACLSNEAGFTRIRASIAEGQRAQINSTPSFMLGDQLIRGEVTFEALSAALDTALAA